jgi:hypothetical protein
MPAPVPQPPPVTDGTVIWPPPAPPPTAEHDGHEWYQSIYLVGDYLLVRPRRNALDFAILSPQQSDTAVGSVESVGWETRGGIRYGGGLRLADDAWRLSITHTYFYTSGSASLQAPPGGQLFATLTRGGSIDDVSQASAFTSLNYHVLDLDATRCWSAGKGLDMQFSGGGRFAWIDQKLRAVYDGGSAGAVGAVVDSPVSFRGGGLTAGALGMWHGAWGLGAFTRARLSILEGQFENFHSETNGNGQVTIVNVKERYQQIVPVAEVSAGVMWECDHIHLSVAYELANWFDMVNSPDFSTGLNVGKVTRRTSDLTIEGMAVELAFLF